MRILRLEGIKSFPFLPESESCQFAPEPQKAGLEKEDEMFYAFDRQGTPHFGRTRAEAQAKARLANEGLSAH
ncbi:MAG: hypothetical protein HYT50_00250 [Candidatus Wildermuthbacteria bacterium]|nr:hypothetical protein [Candidatus Wildermuthbacteria bacterium]